MDELAADDVPVLTVLMELIQVESWDDAKAVVLRNPILLTDRALVLLDLVAGEVGTPEADDDATRIFGRFLRRCREIGIDAAGAEMAGDIPLPDWMEPLADLILNTDDVDVELGAYHDMMTDSRFWELVPALRAQILARASSALLRRAEIDPSDDDIDQAMRQLDLSTTLAADETPAGREILGYLLFGHVLRIERGGISADYEAAVGVMRRQDRREGTALGSRAHYLTSLGHALQNRYEQRKLRGSLDGCLRALEWAVGMSADDDPELAGRLGTLGAAYLRKYEVDGGNGDLELSIALLSRAVNGTPPSAPERPEMVNDLGSALLTRYERAGDAGDLDDAITHLEESIAATPHDVPARAVFLNNYSLGLWRRYERSGRSSDVDGAIAALQEATARTTDLREKASLLTNLGFNLRRRYERSGRLDDLDAGIAALREAVGLQAHNPMGAHHAVHNLGVAVLQRYQNTLRVDDLDEATDLLRRAIDMTSPGAPELPTFLANLGGALRVSIEAHDMTDNMNEMVESFQRAVDLTPGGSPEEARHLGGLGYGLLLRNRSADLTRATEIMERAVSLTPAGSPDLPRRLSLYGVGLMRRASSGRKPRRRRSAAIAEQATTILRRACESGLAIDPHTTFTTSLTWGDWAQYRRAWPEAGEAYGFGLTAMRALVGIQLVRTEKESWLRQSGDLAAAAAFAYSATGAAVRAVVALEQGRATLLDEALQRDRANLEQLRAGGRQDLVERYERAAGRVRDLQAPATAAPLG